MSFFKPNPSLSSPLFQQGVEHGKSLLSNEILTWLQQKYMDDGVTRKTPQAEAILELTKELANFLRDKL